MKYKVGDVVKIVPMDYPQNEDWLRLAGRIGSVEGLNGSCKYGDKYFVDLLCREFPVEFFDGELVMATDVDILAAKLRGE